MEGTLVFWTSLYNSIRPQWRHLPWISCDIWDTIRLERRQSASKFHEKDTKTRKAYKLQDSGKQETEDEMQRWIQVKGACQDLNCLDISKATGLDGSSAHFLYSTAAGYQHIISTSGKERDSTMGMDSHTKTEIRLI